MARGAKEQRQLSEKQLAKENERIGGQEAVRSGYRTDLTNRATGLMDSGGYAPEEKAGILQSLMEATGTPFDVAGASAKRRAARTGATAGYGALTAQLAREKGATMGNAARDVEVEFGRQKRADRDLGLQLLANLYGTETGLLGQQYGLPYEALRTRAAGIGPSFADQLAMKWLSPYGGSS